MAKGEFSPSEQRATLELFDLALKLSKEEDTPLDEMLTIMAACSLALTACFCRNYKKGITTDEFKEQLQEELNDGKNKNQIN